ncbi:MAG: gamma carbonic anhydrase family protein [Spirochaetae bacterium HGW-Spirochaetae-1]|jgi:carbonic anhydrase/acetyltransferase-like protein (isoleucine patch superfamily)|nr:MAG: gamma carbonic anhydrase family protein [Spirochaetae bacterium HGW-Spirochaetae-1]
MKYTLNGRGPTTKGEHFIADNAVVIGSVILENNASIWFNAVVRGDSNTITIGENSNIQDSCVLHVDDTYSLAIGRDVTVGHKVMLHGCIIGDECLIGINAVILNGAVIGKNCLIGANTLITENKHIPDGSVVMGSPGRVVRQITEDDIETIRDSARHYVKNSRRYAMDLIREE